MRQCLFEDYAIIQELLIGESFSIYLFIIIYFQSLFSICIDLQIKQSDVLFNNKKTAALILLLEKNPT